MDEFIGKTENSVINLLSAVAPWLVPIIPAYLTYWHAIRELGFPDWVSWCAAIVVEILGFASVRTSISFWEHNKRYKADKNQAPVGVAIIIYMVYLVIILTVNVLLDITSHVRWDKIIAVGLFSLMSFPAGLLIAIRTQHRELLDELSERRSRERSSRSRTGSDDESEPKELTERFSGTRERSTVYASDFENEIVELVEQIYNTEHRIPGPTEVARTLELNPETSKGYISTRTKQWKSENGISK